MDGAALRVAAARLARATKARGDANGSRMVAGTSARLRAAAACRGACAPRAPLGVFGVLARGRAVTAEGVLGTVSVEDLLALAVVVRRVERDARALSESGVVRAGERRVELCGEVHHGASLVHEALWAGSRGKVGVTASSSGSGGSHQRADNRELHRWI